MEPAEAETTETEDEKVKRLEAAEENKPLKFLPDGVSDVLTSTQRSMKAAKEGFAACRAASDRVAAEPGARLSCPACALE